MADVLKEATLIVTFRDESLDAVSRRYQVDTASGVLATVLATAQALLADVMAASDCGVSGYSLELSYTPETPTTAQAGAKVEDTALISLPLVTAAPDQLQTYGNVSMPGPKIGMFLASSGEGMDTVDMADALVTGLAANFQAAGGCYLSHGQVVAASIATGSGRRVSKKSGAWK